MALWETALAKRAWERVREEVEAIPEFWNSLSLSLWFLLSLLSILQRELNLFENERGKGLQLLVNTNYILVPNVWV
jgi:hypothetical protein